MFTFDRCHRSLAAETPGKYERPWKYLTYAFAISKFPVTEKLTNGALVTNHPRSCQDDDKTKPWQCGVVQAFQEVTPWPFMLVVIIKWYDVVKAMTTAQHGNWYFECYSEKK